MEPLEPTQAPWAQGVVSSNLADPTKTSIPLYSNNGRTNALKVLERQTLSPVKNTI